MGAKPIWRFQAWFQRMASVGRRFLCNRTPEPNGLKFCLKAKNKLLRARNGCCTTARLENPCKALCNWIPRMAPCNAMKKIVCRRSPVRLPFLLREPKNALARKACACLPCPWKKHKAGKNSLNRFLFQPEKPLNWNWNCRMQQQKQNQAFLFRFPTSKMDCPRRHLDWKWFWCSFRMTKSGKKPCKGLKAPLHWI